MNGLVAFKSNAQLEAEQAQQQQHADEQRSRDAYEQSIAGQIRRDWDSAKQAKRSVEQRMLACLRRRKGEYDASKLHRIREAGGSEIFMQLTATKCRAAAAWIRDVLLPVNERAWGLEPTPVADVAPAVRQRLSQQIEQTLAQRPQPGTAAERSAMMDAALAELQTRANSAARAAARKMETVIADQLTEGGWVDALELFIEDFVTFPGAVLKAPVLRKRAVLKWGDNWQPIKSFEITPQVERVSPLDLYPSQDARTPDDAAFIFERARFSRADLSAMRGVPGYNDSAIDTVLQQHGQGGLQDWLWSDSERASIEGRGEGNRGADATLDGLIYYGSAMGLSLLEWGVPPDQVNPLDDYDIEAILIGRHVIRLVIQSDPLQRRPYHIASFQQVPGSFWGQGIPELMADLQDTCNATARALINNLAIASGPQTEVNFDRLAPGEDATAMFPWKVWQTKSSMATGNAPAIRFFQPASNAAELMGVYEKFEQKADEVTNIPRYMYGSPQTSGAGATASGLSMLMESANKGIKAAIGHIDKGAIRRTIEGFWLYNMLYHPDTAIKGDCKAVARGSSAMLLRERTQLLRQQFLAQTANPVDMQIIGIENRARLLATVANQLDIPDLLDDPSQIAQQLQQANSQNAQRQQQAQQLEQAEQQARIASLQATARKTEAEAAAEPVASAKLQAEIRHILANLNRHEAPDDQPPRDRPAALEQPAATEPATGLQPLPELPEQPAEQP